MPDKLARVAVLVSGGGSNLQALLDAKQRGELPVEFVLVLSSRGDAKALERAEARSVPTEIVERRAFDDEAGFQSRVLQLLESVRPDVICLAGYMRKLSPEIIARFRGRILNIHPALLPKFGGPGMYGHHVHAAVLAAKEKESGCTVHMVDEEFDHGPILAQATVPVQADDSIETLAERVLKQEHRLYRLVLKEFCEKLNVGKS